MEESQVVKIGETLIDLGHQVYFHDFNLDNYSYSKMIGFQRVQNFDEVDFNKFDLIVFSQKEEGYRVVLDLINKESSRIMDLWGLFDVNS
jgi:UDP-N-acetyl-D-mannosaminuronate dehydrogenase